MIISISNINIHNDRIYHLFARYTEKRSRCRWNDIEFVSWTPLASRLWPPPPPRISRFDDWTCGVGEGRLQDPWSDERLRDEVVCCNQRAAFHVWHALPFHRALSSIGSRSCPVPRYDAEQYPGCACRSIPSWKQSRTAHPIRHGRVPIDAPSLTRGGTAWFQCPRWTFLFRRCHLLFQRWDRNPRPSSQAPLSPSGNSAGRYNVYILFSFFWPRGSSFQVLDPVALCLLRWTGDPPET